MDVLYLQHVEMAKVEFGGGLVNKYVLVDAFEKVVVFG
jgi:hypothetical protein